MDLNVLASVVNSISRRGCRVQTGGKRGPGAPGLEMEKSCVVPSGSHLTPASSTGDPEDSIVTHSCPTHSHILPDPVPPSAPRDMGTLLQPVSSGLV